jgi:murein L,D-transpeptidase YafK
MNYFALFLFLMATASQAQSFRELQLKNPRVKGAFNEKGSALTTLLESKGIKNNDYQLFIQAFKQEGLVEVWVKGSSAATYQLLITYPFCSTSGELGPKRKEGDLQIPEGVYYIQHFNPQSNFHLSLGINYPNASDKILSDPKHPGGAIYIHGNCVTIGCIPITDDKIKELYLLAMYAKNNGQQKIPVYIFPDRLDLGAPEKLAAAQPAHLNFWKNLQTVYLDFKTTRVLKKVSVLKDGNYSL